MMTQKTFLLAGLISLRGGYVTSFTSRPFTLSIPHSPHSVKPAHVQRVYLGSKDFLPELKNETCQKDNSSALHELEHRAKHVGTVEGSKILTEKIVQSIEKAVPLIEKAGEHLTERTGERIAKTSTERIAERSADRLAERAAERLGETVGERFAERSAENLVDRTGKILSKKARGRLAEQAGDHLAERAVENVIERTGERIAERGAERAGERVTKGTAENISKRWSRAFITGRATERTAERASERIAERSTERIVEEYGERIVERTTKQLVERGGEHSGWRPLKRLWEPVSNLTHKRGIQTTAEHAATVSIERAAERGSERAVERSLLPGRRILLRRLGRGALIVVPVLGGLFASFLFKSDICRMKEEWRNSRFACAIFGGAALADGVDTCCHFLIAFSLLTKTFGHHQMVVIEELSLTCAFGSIACAVGGELISHRVRKYKSSRDVSQGTE